MRRAAASATIDLHRMRRDLHGWYRGGAIVTSSSARHLASLRE